MKETQYKLMIYPKIIINLDILSLLNVFCKTEVVKYFKIDIFIKHLLIVLLSSLSLTAFAQEFSFQLFFADAIGNKDTITLGYDSIATDKIDSLFGEENIIKLSPKSGLDIRLSDEYFLRNYSQTTGTYHCKKQILKFNCRKSASTIAQTIDINTKNWPVTVTWDPSLFNDQCKDGSVFTSIHPGGWWDTGSKSNLHQQILANNGEVSFSSNCDRDKGYCYISKSDTIAVFWLAIGTKSILRTSIDDIKHKSAGVVVFPNPTSSQFTVQLEGNLLTTISIHDIHGQELIKQTFENATTINVEHLLPGLYYYKLYNLKTAGRSGIFLKK